MAIRQVGFQPRRLTQARALRGIGTMQELASLTDLSKQMISRYESGKSIPPEDKVRLIASRLNLELRFFFIPIQVCSDSPAMFRSVRDPLRQAIKRSQSLLEIAEESLSLVEEYVELPKYTLPRLNPSGGIQSLTVEMIENAAVTTRELLGFASGPLPNLVTLAERAGIVVVRTFLAERELDGLSRWREPHPIVILNDSKTPARSRFDLAHEIGHLVLHSYVPRDYLQVKSLFRLLEEQAHTFASALLLPRDEFRNDVWTGTLDEFQSLKPRWQTSIQAMVRRSKDLGIISDEEYRRLFTRIGARGWRFKEPLEDAIPDEIPTVLRTGIEIVYDEVPGGDALISAQLPFGNLLEEVSSGELSWISGAKPSNIIHLKDFV